MQQLSATEMRTQKTSDHVITPDTGSYPSSDQFNLRNHKLHLKESVMTCCVFKDIEY